MSFAAICLKYISLVIFPPVCHSMLLGIVIKLKTESLCLMHLHVCICVYIWSGCVCVCVYVCVCVTERQTLPCVFSIRKHHR